MATSSFGTRSFSVWVLAFGLLALSPPARAVGERPTAARPGNALRGAGGWQRDTRGAGPAQRWQIDLTRRDDDAVEGTVTLVGSPLMQTGTLRGAIEGRKVSGRITDPAGNHVADFVGRIAADGTWRGSYQDRTGEVGRWSWNGTGKP
jgi:hypothetical protein